MDAVWPGWGHASENPLLPSTLSSMNITFVGPSATVMAALGDKIAANILAQTARVPSIPWSGDGLTAALNEEGKIPDEVCIYLCSIYTKHNLSVFMHVFRAINMQIWGLHELNEGFRGVGFMFFSCFELPIHLNLCIHNPPEPHLQNINLSRFSHVSPGF